MIAGLQKMTLLDFPGKVACTVFLQGCNYRCPFCHNSELLPRQGEPFMDTPALLTFLERRAGILEAVCISGGEPTLDPELETLLRSVKALGYAVKLDTNGSRPEHLKRLVSEGLVDYVAMDVKNSPARYAQTVGLAKVDLEAVEESLRFLLSGAVDYELRTTLVEQLHDKASVEEMGCWVSSVGKPKKWFLQSFVDRDTVTFSGLSAPDEDTLTMYRELLSACGENVAIRGR